MQNADIETLEHNIHNLSEVVRIYENTAKILRLESETVLIESRVMFEYNREQGVPYLTCVALSLGAVKRRKELIKASKKNYRKAQIHSRRLLRLMLQYDALTEG
jgi:hypothetical protein